MARLHKKIEKKKSNILVRPILGNWSTKQKLKLIEANDNLSLTKETAVNDARQFLLLHPVALFPSPVE